MKKQPIPSRFAWFREVAIAALAALALSACERTQPSPDPAPAPPAPQTMFHHAAPSVHHAVFTLPAKDASGRQHTSLRAARHTLVKS